VPKTFLSMPEVAKKRKRPPTFDKFPANRGECLFLCFRGSRAEADPAKKLKQAWVMTVKTKSRWKAEKRREGLKYQSEKTTEKESEDEKDAESNEGGMMESETKTIPTEDDISRHRRDLYPTQKKTKTPTTASLRDLAREAYSPSALHHYKSHPLHRRKEGSEGSTSEVRRGEMGNETNGKRTRREDGRKERRGQPNMRLRMNFMLEKIKRDFT
jgi:hypothetical protein